MINLLVHTLAFLFTLGITFGSIICLVMWACKGQEDY